MLYVTKHNLVRELVQAHSAMTVILANSTTYGGAGNEFAVGSLNSDWTEIMCHELGHSFGKLKDEYWWEAGAAEAPNMTQNNDVATVKWSQWIGYKGVGVYQYETSGRGSEWYRPHQACRMRELNNDFCSVCSTELIRLMEQKAGALFDITDIGENNVRIDNLNLDVSGTFEIPERINGRVVTEIGSSAFANLTKCSEIILPPSITHIGQSAFENCNELTTITLPNGLLSIGNKAFKGCTSLGSISIKANVQSIGDQAFADCNNLNLYAVYNNQNFSSSRNILYNKEKTKIIASGKVDAEIAILNSVTEIAPYAFAENSNINTIRFEHNPSIGANAFDSCENLVSVYFYSFSTPSNIGENSFANNNFTLYTPYFLKDAYGTIFAEYTNSIDYIELQILFYSNGALIDTLDIYYGSYIDGIISPTRVGYSFGGWYDNQNFTGEPYQDGEMFARTENLPLYGKWTANQYTVSLNANNGVLNGNTTMSVTYDASFATSTTASREGYTFEGWYDAVSGGTKYMTANGESTRLWDKTANTTLYARWAVKSYEIQINDNGSIVWLGASGLSENECSIEYGTVLNAINLIASYKQSNHGFKEGKIFDHFEYNNNTLNWESVPDLGESGEVITIVPVWILEEHTIYFNVSGVNVIRTLYDNSISLPVINRTGYVFNGWYDSETGGSRIVWTKIPDLTPTQQNNGSIMLYARFTAQSYVVTFDKQGGSGGTNSVDVTYNSAMPSGKNKPSKGGYTFLGYYSGQNGAGKQYYSKDMASVNNWDISHNTTLYANWEANKYNVQINLNDKEGNKINITVEYGKLMPNFAPRAPKKLGYRFVGIYDNEKFTGSKYYESTADLDNGYSQNLATNYTWNSTSGKTLYVKWEAITMNMEVYYDCFGEDLSEIKTFSITTGESLTLTAPSHGGYNFQKWIVLVRANNEWGIGEGSEEKTEKTITYVMEAWLGGESKYIFQCVYDKACVAEGTMITLEDGSQKAVENLTGNERLLVWNLFTGQFDTAPILFIDSDSARNYEVINLTFSDSTTIKVIAEHAFWDFNLNEYVFLRRDAARYIGHWFNKQTTDENGNLTWKAVQLTDVQLTTELTRAFSPVTFGHLCYYVNGMLSMPGATTGLINIFEVNPNTMKIDNNAYLADIAEYGLFTYEEFAELYNVPETIFDAFGGKYLKVAMGKGLLTEEKLLQLIQNYADFFEVETPEDIQSNQNANKKNSGNNVNHYGHSNGNNGNHYGHGNGKKGKNSRVVV